MVYWVASSFRVIRLGRFVEALPSFVRDQTGEQQVDRTATGFVGVARIAGSAVQVVRGDDVGASGAGGSVTIGAAAGASSLMATEQAAPGGKSKTFFFI